MSGPKSKDGEHVDVFIGPDTESDHVYIVNQVDPKTKKFDEHKVMLGFSTKVDAVKGYKSNYNDNADKRIGTVVCMSVEQFKDWLAGGDTQKPVTLKSVRDTLNTQADMLDVVRNDAGPLQEWTRLVGHPQNRFFVRSMMSSLAMTICGYVKRHMNGSLRLQMFNHGYPRVEAMILEAPMWIAIVNTEAQTLSFVVCAPWASSVWLMSIDVPFEEARLDLRQATTAEIQALHLTAGMPLPVRDQLDYPNFAAVADITNADDERQWRAIVEAEGAHYNGVQDMRSRGRWVFFTDKQTHSTAALPVGDLTTLNVRKKLQELRARFDTHI